MKKVLVTGGFGFLGTHLVERLLREPDVHVHVVDNLSSNPVELGFFLDSIDQARLSYDIATVKQYFTKEPEMFHAVYHLASPVGPAGVLKFAGNMVREIVSDCYQIIDYCLASGASLLDVSTSEIYGGGQQGYCPETTPKIVPAETTIRLEYAIGKLAAETAIINTCRVTDLRAVIVRPFNVAGPRQSPKGGFVLPRFLQLAHDNRPLTLFGDGSAVRAFTHVSDMVDGIYLALEKGESGEAYNIGNPVNKLSMLEFAEQVIDQLGSNSTIDFVDPKELYGPLYEEANDKYPDNEKAVRVLGWEPRFSVSQIVDDAYRDYLAQVKSGVLLTVVNR